MKVFAMFWFLAVIPAVLVLNAIGGFIWFEHNLFSGIFFPLAMIASELVYAALLLKGAVDSF